MCRSFVSLMYHNVRRADDGDRCAEYAGLSPSITGYFVDDAAFGDQMRSLSGRFRAFTYDELEEVYSAGSSQQARRARKNAGLTSAAGVAPAVQITFDDGWRGCVELGGPVLEEYGWQALLFVTTDLIGQPHFLTESELQRLPGGCFRVGSHAKTHRFLNELTEPAIREELRISKDVLEQIIGEEVDAVSIPNGAVDRRVREIACEAGYRFVFTSDVHRNTRARGPLRIGRIPIRERTSTEDVLRFAGGDFQSQWWRQAVLSAPKRLLGAPRYRRLRARILGESRSDLEMTDFAAG